MSTKLLLLAPLLFTACLEPEPEPEPEPDSGSDVAERSAATASPADAVVAAETTFRAAVLSTTVTAAANATMPITRDALRITYGSDHRTLAAGRSTRSTLVFFSSRQIGAMPAGVYELYRTASGAVALDHASGQATGKRIHMPVPPPQPFSTPFGDDMCPDAPSGLAEYCQAMVACYAYDIACW